MVGCFVIMLHASCMATISFNHAYVSTDYYDAISSEYDDLWGFVHGAWADVIIKELDIQPNDHVAEIGAGTGALSEIIWNRVGMAIGYLLALESWACQGTKVDVRLISYLDQITLLVKSIMGLNQYCFPTNHKDTQSDPCYRVWFCKFGHATSRLIATFINRKVDA